ncbi:MAG: helix-turn-helix domain-containing protein [Hyphomicrobiaceae bacterium]
MSDHVPLGSLVRDARRLRNLSQDELAEALKVSRMTVSQLERGRPKKPLDADFVNRLARVLDLPVVEMLAAMGYALDFDGLQDEREVTLLRLYRATPPPYQRAVLRGLQELAQDGADG